MIAAVWDENGCECRDILKETAAATGENYGAV